MSNNKQQPKKQENQFSQMMRNFWGDELDAFEDWGFPHRHYHPNISLSEDEKNIYIDAALPGLDEKEIEVTIENRMLWIRGQKHETENHKKYHYKAKSAYSYQIALPDSVDASTEPDAKYEKGVLNITFKKKRGEEPKRINIKTR